MVALPVFIAVILPLSTFTTLSSLEDHSISLSFPSTLAPIVYSSPILSDKTDTLKSIVGSLITTFTSIYDTLSFASLAKTLAVYSPAFE